MTYTDFCANGGPTTSRVRVFISHDHSDKEAASELRGCLVTALGLATDEIRCTSSPGSKGNYGEFTDELRADLDACSIVLVIVTSTSIKSAWVQSEIGASWALGKVLVPILAPGITIEQLDGPLFRNRAIISDNTDEGGKTTELVELIKSISKSNNLTDNIDGWVCDKISSFWKKLTAIPPCDDYCEQNKVFTKKINFHTQQTEKSPLVLCHSYFNVIKNSELVKTEHAIELFFRAPDYEIHNPVVWSLLGSMEIAVTFRSLPTICKKIQEDLDKYVKWLVSNDAIKSEHYILNTEFIRCKNSFIEGRRSFMDPSTNHRSTFAFIKLQWREDALGIIGKIGASQRIGALLTKQLLAKEDYVVDLYGISSCEEHMILEIQIPCGYQDSLKSLSQTLQSELVYWNKSTFIAYHVNTLNKGQSTELSNFSLPNHEELEHV